MTYTWAISLENVLEETGELDHLYRLVELKRQSVSIEAENRGELAEKMFVLVINPLLEELEVYLRGAMQPGMEVPEVKVLVSDWIDTQMALLLRSGGGN
jgi:hypothetical protein